MAGNLVIAGPFSPRNFDNFGYELVTTPCRPLRAFDVAVLAWERRALGVGLVKSIVHYCRYQVVHSIATDTILLELVRQHMRSPLLVLGLKD